ncbi:hypothetical protein TSAR_007725 [Trichomalopsis sarcophagae]|uniref:Uncharacterized protein n=1 Tax=Trichomalopsis sarcophagae TaxID=543379 RepID=A0A232EH03_9HYME|nr:hypothetical protein TSAR_007725 [Trichomalopsis sarcophagae]
MLNFVIIGLNSEFEEKFSIRVSGGESTFNSIGHLNRHIGHHNSHYWSAINQHWMQQIDNQHRWNINVWCGRINGNLIGPYFFEGCGCNKMELNHSTEILNDRFPNRSIGRGGPIAWPPRSPGLIPLDFYLWGYHKNTVYREKLTTAYDMRMRIQNACANIPRNVLIRTVGHFQQRLQLCLQVGLNGVQNPIVQPPRGVCRVTLMPKIKFWVLNIKFVSIAIKIPFEEQTQHITLKAFLHEIFACID